MPLDSLQKLWERKKKKDLLKRALKHKLINFLNFQHRKIGSKS